MAAASDEPPLTMRTRWRAGTVIVDADPEHQVPRPRNGHASRLVAALAWHSSSSAAGPLNRPG
jgi:hypothetical protein